nr:hypothetical protein [Tanacetum cinerariifolium]
MVFTDREIQNYTLLELEMILNGNNKSLLDFPQLPHIDYSLMNIRRNRLIAAERMYNMDEEWAQFTTLYASLIIWDEAPLQHRHAFEAVDQTFRDICKHDNPNAENEVFGGKVVVLGGDFRKILPVIQNAPRAVVVASAINKSSAIWDNCRVFVLTTNMRLPDPSLDVACRDEMIHFNNCLLSMGDGTLHSVVIDNEDEATWVEIPDDLLLPTCDNPIEAIVSSEMYVLHSADIICSTTENLEEMQTIYPTKFLNTLKFLGVLNHNLKLKVGAPVMLLRNTGLQR